MPLHVNKMICRIRVKTGKQSGSLHQQAQHIRPSLQFAQPEPAPRGETAPEPSQTATEPSEEGTERQVKASPGKADTRAVADRVYDLMKEELSLGRLRGKPW